ncbi:hypothetical protein [Cylindrospermopsis raciborskii]|uniref:hypothetical protein n=2 Tax=Cylindrospermopsis raciborskii TaxID=77022 RepID=UPI000A90BF5E|nr:hypothetical protein [Cylindrospermopsis raciborskii]
MAPITFLLLHNYTKEKQVMVDSEIQQLVTLNQELKNVNNDLCQKLERLSKELGEAEKVLQWQKKRSSVSESMLNQQNQEITAAQERIQSLSQQLETALRNMESQEMFVETHKAESQLNQQRIAQLERECTLLQTKCSEQSQQLLQSENTCRELGMRLLRQQRQTLQFKAALEKCLDNPAYNDQGVDDTSCYLPDINPEDSRFYKKLQSLFSRGEPIRPWSAMDYVESEFNQPINENTMDVSEEISHVDQRLEDILSVFFASNPDLSSTSDIPTKGEGTSFLGGEEDEPGPTMIPAGLKDMNNLPKVNLLSDNTIDTSDQQNNYDPQWSINTVEPLEQDSEQKSPSPLIYPGRTVKVRKTLAAVELPNFPPQSQNAGR